MPKSTSKKVPARAFRFESGEAHLQFEDASPAQGPPRASITMLARTGEPIHHWYWGRIVHDMAGMKLRKEQAPIDWCHDYGEIIGVLREFKATNKGLTVKGELIAFREDDRAAEVIFKGQAGIPYEASIDWSGGGARIEEVGEGVTVQVNGKKFTGPGYVVREWPLRAVAVCPYGADPNTRSQFAGDDAAELDVTIFSASATDEEDDMSVTQQQDQQPPKEAAQQKEQQPPKEGAAPPSATQQTEQPSEAKPAEGQPAPAQQAEPTDERSKFALELKRFTERFGAENGTKWFTEGKTFAEALELHSELLQKQLTAANAKIADQEKKLGAVPRGEKDPLSFADGDKQAKEAADQNRFSGLGTNLAKFAGAIKLPGK